MADTKLLIEERGQIDHKIRGIVEKAETENRTLNAEEKKSFDELHARDMELKERVDRLDWLAKRDAELSKVRDHGVDRRQFPASATGKPPSEKREEITDEECGLAIQAWARRQYGIPLSKRQKAAATKYREQVDRRFHPDRRELSLSFSPNDQFRALQHRFRTTHPETRDVSTSTASSFIPQGFVNRLEIALLAYGPMLQVAEVLTTDSGNALPWPTADDTGNEGEQLDQATTIGSSVDPTMSSMTLNAYKMSSKLIKVSTEIIEDSAFDLTGSLGDWCGERLGRIINRKCTTANGSGTPNGIVNAATLGVTAALSNAIAADELFDLQHSVDPAYRNGAAWMMHDSTLAAIRKLKDQQNQYLFQPGLQLGVPDRLLSAPIFINQHMDGLNDVGDSTDSSEKVLLYGQLSKYKIRRVKGIRMRRLVERYADTDQEGFVAFARVDGDLLDAGTHPVKYLQLA